MGEGSYPVEWVSVDDLSPNPFQPRTDWPEEELAELARSLTQDGFLHPLVARRLADGSLELVSGERRLRASRMAGFESVPVSVRDHVTDQTSRRLALTENIHRSDLSPVEEAHAYQTMSSELGLTHEEIAKLVSKSRTHVTGTLSLLRLPPPVQSRLAAGTLTSGHGRILLRIRDPWLCVRMADKCIAEGLSVRSLEELVLLGNLDGWESERPKPPAKRRKATPSAIPPDLIKSAEGHLEGSLSTRVAIKAGRSRGRILIDFADEEDLRRILDVLGADKTEPPTG